LELTQEFIELLGEFVVVLVLMIVVVIMVMIVVSHAAQGSGFGQRR
jgi:hypothetical protein